MYTQHQFEVCFPLPSNPFLVSGMCSKESWPLNFINDVRLILDKQYIKDLERSKVSATKRILWKSFGNNSTIQHKVRSLQTTITKLVLLVIEIS